MVVPGTREESSRNGNVYGRQSLSSRSRSYRSDSSDEDSRPCTTTSRSTPPERRAKNANRTNRRNHENSKTTHPILIDSSSSPPAESKSRSKLRESIPRNFSISYDGNGRQRDNSISVSKSYWGASRDQSPSRKKQSMMT